MADIYGQNLAAAESLTGAAAPWAWSPATLKPTADQELLNGINRFVIHESAHQPLVGKAPGPRGPGFDHNARTLGSEAKRGSGREGDFSGIGTYTKSVQASPEWFKMGARLWIDLGDVKKLAAVTVNGKDLGQLWH